VLSNMNSMSPMVELQRIFARTEELCGVITDSEERPNEEIRELLRRMKDVAAELMRENERLRMQNLLLERQRAEADQRLSGSQLGKENEELKRELSAFERRVAALEFEAQKYRRRYEELAQRNSALLNVFVAANRLHSTLASDEVIRIAEEILWDMIAASAFAIFLRDEKRGGLVLVGGRGVQGHRFDINDELIAALENGTASSMHGDEPDAPLALIPLKLEDGTVTGLIVVYAFAEHKRGASELDRMLFEMLASQMATAIMCARLYGETIKKLRSMESFINLIKPA